MTLLRILLLRFLPAGRLEGFVVVNSNGSGGFNTPVYYEASQQTFDVAIVDLDNDGDGDVHYTRELLSGGHRS